MARQTPTRGAGISRLDEHPNLPDILSVLAQLAHVDDRELPLLAAAWVNSPALAEARDRALAPDSPLIVEVLGAFEAVSALFADDLAGEASYLTVDRDVTVLALKAVRDAVAAAYARPVLTRRQYDALMRPWQAVYPGTGSPESDLGPRAGDLKHLLASLPVLAGRCHDATGRSLFDTLVDRSFVQEGDRAAAAATAFDAAVMTSRRRLWALVRRTGTLGLSRPCPTCRPGSPGGPAATVVDDERELERVLAVFLDATCALLVADALSDATTELLTDPVSALVPHQRMPDRSS